MLVPKIKKKFNALRDPYLTHVLLNDIEPVDIQNSDCIFVFNQVISKFTEKLYILVSHELARHKVASCFLYYKDFLRPHYPRLEIEGFEISNSCVAQKGRGLKPFHELPLFYEWTVDIDGDRIEAEGFNFFPFVKNTLRKIQKRFNVFYNDEIIRDLVRSCDLLLKYFSLLKSYSQETGKKIRLVGYEVDYVPNGILRFLCDQSSHNRDIEFIELRRGYIGYFGQHHHRASYISLSNLTRTKMESGLTVSKEELVGFDEKSLDLDELAKPVSNALAKSTNFIPSDRQGKIIETIEGYQSRGNRVFVLFPHLFYDTPVYDESDVFNNMCEWIEETIGYFDGKDDLLLIKPHPSEFISDQPKKAPTETLASFLADIELPENTVILARDLFTVKDLSPFTSCGLIWRSSVAMELTFLGIPCIIAGNPPYRALDINYAKDKEHYFDMIAHAHTLRVTDKQKIEIAKYLYLLEHKHIHIDCITYDTNLRKFYWVGTALRKYLKDGNKEVESVVEQMLA
jgi:hypothetical protein